MDEHEMKDCISRKEATEFINKCLEHEEKLQSVERETLIAVKKHLESIPAADVRPVVQCRECVHWERYDNTAGCGYCHKVKFEYGADGYVFNPVREPDFYCADGRKADA